MDLSQQFARHVESLNTLPATIQNNKEEARNRLSRLIYHYQKMYLEIDAQPDNFVVIPLKELPALFEVTDSFFLERAREKGVFLKKKPRPYAKYIIKGDYYHVKYSPFNDLGHFIVKGNSIGLVSTSFSWLRYKLDYYEDVKRAIFGR